MKILMFSSGHVVDLIETLDFHYNEAELTQHRQWRANHSAIIFTSPRAIIAFNAAGLDANPSDLCFVVGPATSEQAKKAGFRPVGGEQTGDAEELAKFIIQGYTSSINVDIVTAYSSTEHDQLKERLRLHLCERHPIPDCIVYFSPSGVNCTEVILKSELKPHRPTVKLVALGRATAGALRDLGLEVAAVASSPKPRSLLDAVNKLTAGSV